MTGFWFGAFLFFHVLGIVIPTDFHILQGCRGHQSDGYFNGDDECPMYDNDDNNNSLESGGDWVPYLQTHLGLYPFRAVGDDR